MRALIPVYLDFPVAAGFVQVVVSHRSQNLPLGLTPTEDQLNTIFIGSCKEACPVPIMLGYNVPVFFEYLFTFSLSARYVAPNSRTRMGWFINGLGLLEEIGLLGVEIKFYLHTIHAERLLYRPASVRSLKLRRCATAYIVPQTTLHNCVVQNSTLLMAMITHHALIAPSPPLPPSFSFVCPGPWWLDKRNLS